MRILIALMALVLSSACGGAPDLVARPAAAEAGTAAQAPTLQLPVRIPRSFLEGSVRETVDWSAGKAPVTGVANWQELPTTLPPPGPGALADFRDHPGCVSVDSSFDTCFVVTPDVSSLPVSADKVSLGGLSQWVVQNHASGCGLNGNPSWVGATKSDTQVIIQYSLPTFTGSNCTESVNSQLTITLEKA